jgi:hypothetical protein
MIVVVTRTPLIASTLAAAMRLYESSSEEVRGTYPVSNLHSIESMILGASEVLAETETLLLVHNTW